HSRFPKELSLWMRCQRIRVENSSSDNCDRPTQSCFKQAEPSMSLEIEFLRVKHLAARLAAAALLLLSHGVSAADNKSSLNPSMQAPTQNGVTKPEARSKVEEGRYLADAGNCI